MEETFNESEQRPYVEPKMDTLNIVISIASAILFVTVLIFMLP